MNAITSKKHNIGLFAASVCLCLGLPFFAACSSNSGGGSNDVASIAFSETTITLSINEEKALAPTILPDNATNKDVTWVSSSENIASVSNNGLVKGLTPGTARITATAHNGLSAYCDVVVNAVSVTSIALNKTTTSIAQGYTEALTPTILPTNATDKAIIWASSNENIASVSNSGFVTGLALGTARITATVHNGLSAYCDVVVNTESNPVMTDPIEAVPTGYTAIPTGNNAFVRETDIYGDPTLRSTINVSTSGNYIMVYPNETVDLYFRCNSTGNIKLGLVAGLNANYEMKVGISRRNVYDDGFEEISSQNVQMTRDGSNFTFVPIGEFNNASAGYIRVSLEPVSTSTSNRPTIYYLCVSGASSLVYDGRSSSSYRNGANIHLNYQTEASWGNIEYFYNELKIEEGFDPIRNFFMAIGGTGFYFGMQSNARTDRRILFSVWSTFDTQNPSQIPVEYSVVILKNGDGITQGEFGNEGSGRNCRVNAMWKTGLTYKFLARVQRHDANNKIFTAWYFDPEANKWNLMASYRQPHNNPSLTGWYGSGINSFLECFVARSGAFTSGCHYGNQWARDTNGQWHEVTQAGFSAGNTTTGAPSFRKDYYHAVEGNGFFMKRGGFFNVTTPSLSVHTRPATGVPPNIDLSRVDEYIITSN